MWSGAQGRLCWGIGPWPKGWVRVSQEKPGVGGGIEKAFCTEKSICWDLGRHSTCASNLKAIAAESKRTRSSRVWDPIGEAGCLEPTLLKEFGLYPKSSDMPWKSVKQEGNIGFTFWKDDFSHSVRCQKQLALAVVKSSEGSLIGWLKVFPVAAFKAGHNLYQKDHC